MADSDTPAMTLEALQRLLGKYGQIDLFTLMARLEIAEAASAQPAPYTTYPCHCGIGEADLLDWVDSGLTMTCRKCGTKTVVSLSTDQPAPAPQ